MNNIFEKNEGDDPLQAAKEFGNQFLNYVNNVQQVLADYGRMQSRVAELEGENAKLQEALEQSKRGDEWSNRVTYENVVDQIASNEDAAQRDQARKLIEPLLKRNQVTQFRRDIKKRVKELNEDNGASTFNNYGTYNEVQAGGINITKCS